MQKESPIWTQAYKKWWRLFRWISDNSKNLNQGQKAELQNSATRYFTSLAFRAVEDSPEIYKKFCSEIDSKKIKLRGDIRKVESISVPNVPTNFCLFNIAFKCGDFYGTLTPERYKILKSRGSDDQILLMLLEYAVYVSPSLSWQVPQAVYQCMVEKHGLTLEGCASPVNSQILPFGGKYCSPSLNSDKVFGSVGNLFTTDLEGEVSFINPPFVEDFMESVAIKIQATFTASKKDTTIVFIGPKWTDSKFFLLLSGSPNLKATFQLIKGTHSYEDSGTGKKITAKFNSTIFILSNREVESFEDILQHFK
jgi:hypothetical protein